MRLSIVIPSRNRPEVLADCLHTLAAQESPPSLEVLVIDDGSTEPLEHQMDVASERLEKVRFVRTEGVGLNAARNRGVAEARGDMIAFLDDDTLVSTGWSQAVVEGFTQSDCSVIGGRVVLRLEQGGSLPDWLSEKKLGYLSRYDLGELPREVGLDALPVGANLACRREMLVELAPFRDGLDRVGTELVSNGETELLRRALRNGHRIVYWPDAAVEHRVHGERLTKTWFSRRAFAQGVSDVRTDPPGSPYPVALAREIVRAGRALPILGKRIVQGRSGYEAYLWLVSSRGRISELRRRRSIRV